MVEPVYGSVLLSLLRSAAAVMSPVAIVLPAPHREVVAPSMAVMPSWSAFLRHAFMPRSPILANTEAAMRAFVRSVMTVCMPITVGVMLKMVSVISCGLFSSVVSLMLCAVRFARLISFQERPMPSPSFWFSTSLDMTPSTISVTRALLMMVCRLSAKEPVVVFPLAIQLASVQFLVSDCLESLGVSPAQVSPWLGCPCPEGFVTHAARALLRDGGCAACGLFPLGLAQPLGQGLHAFLGAVGQGHQILGVYALEALGDGLRLAKHLGVLKFRPLGFPLGFLPGEVQFVLQQPGLGPPKLPLQPDDLPGVGSGNSLVLKFLNLGHEGVDAGLVVGQLCGQTLHLGLVLAAGVGQLVTQSVERGLVFLQSDGARLRRSFPLALGRGLSLRESALLCGGYVRH